MNPHSTHSIRFGLPGITVVILCAISGLVAVAWYISTAHNATDEETALGTHTTERLDDENPHEDVQDEAPLEEVETNIESASVSESQARTSAARQDSPPMEVQPAPCTPDMLECWDGSFVGRAGPNCQFAACPVKRVKDDPPLAVPSCRGPDVARHTELAKAHMDTIRISAYVDIDSRTDVGPCYDENISWSQFDVRYWRFETRAGTIVVNGDTEEVTFTPEPMRDTPDLVAIYKPTDVLTLANGDILEVDLDLLGHSPEAGIVAMFVLFNEDNEEIHQYTATVGNYGDGVKEISFRLRNAPPDTYRLRVHIIYSLPAMELDNLGLYIPLARYTTEPIIIIEP